MNEQRSTGSCTTPVDPPEMRRFIPVRDLAGCAGEPLTETASPEERAAIADRFSLQAVDELALAATIAREGADGWRVDGRLKARVTQTCVVTLTPVASAIDEPVRRIYSPDIAADDGLAVEIDIDPDADDPPEPLGAGVDLGAVALETLALAIPPYPRAPGAVFTPRSVAPPGAEPLADEALKPFAELGALKERLERDGDDD